MSGVEKLPEEINGNVEGDKVGKDVATVDPQGDLPAKRMAKLLKGSLLPRLVSEAKFGEDWTLDDVQSAPIGGLNVDHWASTTLSTTLTLKNKTSDKRSVPLVSKCMLPGDGFDSYNKPELQAQNEVNMYNVVFPFFQRLALGSGVPVKDVYPKCYFAESGLGDLLSLTLMEDLRARGFRLAKERAALDREHVSLALRAIGRMHAWSYAAKARCREEFLENVTPVLVEAVFHELWQERWAGVMSTMLHRGYDRVKQRFDAESNQDDARLRQRREKLRRMEDVEKDLFGFLSKTTSATEPMGVIVHGDFCRNNMQFRYDQDGKVAEVCLFDFQNSRYCSPAVDLSFFLFLNTSAELRAAEWNGLLQEYHDTLKSTLDGLLEGHKIHPDFVMPTLQGVHEEMRKHSFYGYSICSFFLPQMMTPPEEMPSVEEMKEMATQNPDLIVDAMLNIGGERATDALADMVLEFLDRNLIP